MSIVNPNFKKQVLDEIHNNTLEKSRIISYTKAAAWYVLTLTEANIPVKVTNLGAGVKRITIEDCVCPNCKGKGYVG